MTDINIVTFNIRCFGFNGDYFSKKRSESRIAFLKNFIQKQYADTDIFVLQEIMDISILNQILPDDFKIYYYNHNYPRHMHIVLACKGEFDFVDVQVIPNTALDETTSRPVIYGQLELNQIPLAQVIGVHLKSSYEHTDNRIKQCELISQFVGNLRTDIPTIMTGDFNSHFKEKTYKKNDDLFYFKKVFDKQLTLVEQNNPTYLALNDSIQLDHFWVHGGTINEIEVYNLHDYAPARAFKKYYDEISDHLPVRIRLGI